MFFKKNLHIEVSERIICYPKEIHTKIKIMLNVALTVGVFVECKLGVTYVGMNRGFIHNLCMSQDE